MFTIYGSSMADTIRLDSKITTDIEIISRVYNKVSVESVMNKELELISKVYADVPTKSIGERI